MSERPFLRRAVFLDRDGTIGEELGYVNHIDRFQIFPFAAEAILQLNQAEIPVIVVTNQSGIARNIFPESLVHEVHKKMVKEQAAREHALDLAASWIVGDRYADLEMGHAAGSRGILVMTGYGRGEYELHRSSWPRQPNVLADNLRDAVRHILQN